MFYWNLYLSLLLVLFLGGCAERGYKLSTNTKTRTVTAQQVVDLDSSKRKDDTKLIHMTKAVKKKLQQQKEKTASATPSKKSVSSKHKIYTTTLENIIFKRTAQTYVKFGNSEIHGHLIYVSDNGLAKDIKDTQVYLVESNKKLDTWYNKFYLKNKIDYSHTTMIHYLNNTTLNIAKNFVFYGVATGSYYIIIASTQSSKTGKDKKIYIAKQIMVKKHKKIMVVFSKKL